jgi:putative endonuclease
VHEFVPGSTRARGARVETLVAELADARGLQIVDRNPRAAGVELDLVAMRAGEGGEPDLYVFIEVRSRADDERGSPIETVDASKRARLVRGATGWLVARDLWERVAVRFDVVGVTSPEAGEPAVEWIEDAFETR